MYVARSPYCEHELDPNTAVAGQVTCPCGRSSDARWVNELGWLQARAAWVAERITAGEAWWDTAAAPGSPAKSEPVTAESTGQRLLYILGGLSLVVAVGVFTAVSWQTLGPVGQGLALLTITLISGAIAWLTRSRLLGLANTMAVISSAVAALTLYAAPQFGLVPAALGDSSSWYPLTVTVGVGGLSLLIGLRSRLLGWAVLGPLAVVVATGQFLGGILAERLSSEDWFSALSVLVLVLGFALLDRLGNAVTMRDRFWSPVDLVAGIGSAMLLVQSAATLAATFVLANRPWLNGLLLLAVAAVLAHMSYRWPVRESRFMLGAFLLRSSGVLAVALAAVGVSEALSEASRHGAVGVWAALTLSAVAGASLFLLPLGRFAAVRELYALVAAWTVWGCGFVLNVGAVFTDERVGSYPLFVYFAVIAAAGLARWQVRNSVLGFVTGAVAGSTSVAILVLELAGDTLRGPEPISFPIAVWLLLCFLALRHRQPELNSGVWLGVPLGVAMLPSAAFAVAALQALQSPLVTDWVRLWVLLGLGMAFTVVGTERGVTGLLWPGAISYILVSFPQIWIDLGLVLPRWSFFAVLGVVLLVIAARFERLARLRKEKGSWGEVFR